MKISQEQIAEWTENPVTLELKKRFNLEIEQLRESKADAYHPFQPERTQEVLANLNGSEDTWELALSSLEGRGVFDDEE